MISVVRGPATSVAWYLEKTISQISRDVQTIKQVQSSHSKTQKSLDEAQLNNQQVVSQLAGV